MSVQMNAFEKADPAQQQRCGRYLIAVLRAVLRGETAPALPERLRWDEVYEMAKFQQLNAMVYAGVAPMLQSEPELAARWKKSCDQGMVQTLTQISEQPRLLAAFSAAGLRVLPVKGSAVRAAYPRPDFRQMGDIDLIIPHEQREQTDKLLQSLGYQTQPGTEEETEIDAELPPYLHVEIHEALLKSDDPNAAYYDDIWQRVEADKTLPGVFHLRTEDEYLYQLLHFIQHYEAAGVGIRQVLDIFLFQKTYGGQMDAAYLNQETEKLNIRAMRELVERLASFWFGDEPGTADEAVRELENFCFLSGLYGGYLSHLICLTRRTQKEQTGVLWKVKYLLHRLFPPFDNLCLRYPRLKKAPWLLPFYWVARLVDPTYWRTRFRYEMDSVRKTKQG